jgi:hypothetical protein
LLKSYYLRNDFKSTASYILLKKHQFVNIIRSTYEMLKLIWDFNY